MNSYLWPNEELIKMNNYPWPNEELMKRNSYHPQMNLSACYGLVVWFDRSRSDQTSAVQALIMNTFLHRVTHCAWGSLWVLWLLYSIYVYGNIVSSHYREREKERQESWQTTRCFFLCFELRFFWRLFFPFTALCWLLSLDLEQLPPSSASCSSALSDSSLAVSSFLSVALSSKPDPVAPMSRSPSETTRMCVTRSNSQCYRTCYDDIDIALRCNSTYDS